MTERLQLIIAGRFSESYQPYDVEFDGHRVLGVLACARRAHDRLNEPVVLKEALDRRGADQALRHEITMLGRLRGRLTEARYPAQLARLIGHNPDHAPPFLVTTCRGEPLRRWESELPFEPPRAGPVLDDLLRILRYLAATGIVHGRIGFDTLRWDGKGLQLTDFEHAALAGDPRRECTCCPAPPPGGTARPADDVTAAGLVIYRLCTGETVSGPAEAAERLALQDAPVRTLLDGVFATTPRQVPDARALLRRRRLPDPLATGGVPSIADGIDEAVRRFEQLRRDQHAFRQTLPRHAGALTAPRPSPLPWLLAGLVLLLAVVAVVAVVAAR